MRLAAVAALAAVVALALAAAAAAPAPWVEVHEARAWLQPEGEAAREQTVTLPHRWDKSFPGRGGRARYTVDLPPVPAGMAPALLLERVGNQADVRLNGTPLQRFGEPGDPYHDAGKLSHGIQVPAALWHHDAPNRIEIDATMQPLRGGGLWPLQAASAEVTNDQLEHLRWRQQIAPAAYATSLLLIGSLAAALWWRQRDALYGCFGLAALFGMLRNVDAIWQPSPLPWPTWGALLAVGYAGHLGFIARFVLLVVQRNPPWMVRGVQAALAAAMALGVLSFALRAPALWTAGLVGLEAVGLACFGVVLHEAWTQRRLIAWLVVGVGGLLLAAGLHDIVLVRLGLGAGDSVQLTPHALFFCVLILAGIFVDRYNRSVAAHRALNATLAERVTEREQQLRAAFEALRLQRDEQATLAERQRIMREIHDGIGSQLVGLLNMVGDSDRKTLEEHIRLALDEMRMAVDSLQPGHGDLTTVLATLRYRLQPRLQAARIEVVWDVAALPTLTTPSPQVAWHLQRILLEAFTNVLKHAQARRVTVQARWRDTPAAVLLTLQDDGVGPPAAGSAHGGHGLQNMVARAQAIGAALRIEAAPGGGTAVLIEWPLENAATPAPADQ